MRGTGKRKRGFWTVVYQALGKSNQKAATPHTTEHAGISTCLTKIFFLQLCPFVVSLISNETAPWESMISLLYLSLFISITVPSAPLFASAIVYVL